MSVQVTLRKINHFLLEIKTCLNQNNSKLPLLKCSREFDFQSKIMRRVKPVELRFSKTSVRTVLRIVEILNIVRGLLLNNKFITKRNLYYQLVKYYAYYGMLDGDLLMICDSLRIERLNLNVIASSKLQLFWFNCNAGLRELELVEQNVQIKLAYHKFVEQQKADDPTLEDQKYNLKKLGFLPKEHIKLVPNQIFKIPNCPKLEVNMIFSNSSHSSNRINFLIMEKQSLFQILTQSLTFKLPKNNEHWLLINSKGYPDMTALQFVNQIFKLSQTNNIDFYYIGDYDVYGIDIMINYAIGNQSFQGLWPKLKWLCQFDLLIKQHIKQDKNLQLRFQYSEHRKQTFEDKKKTKEILSRDYFQIQKLIQVYEKTALQRDKIFIEKVRRWKKVIENLLTKDYQCEVESYFKNWLHPFDVIELMIQKKLYI